MLARMTNPGPHLLGRIAPPDDTHITLHPFLLDAPPPQGIEVNIKRPTLLDYNQRSTPKCVAYSTSRVVNWFNRYAFDADWLYAECKKVDGMPNQDGTNARAACDVLRSKGHWRRISGRDVKTGPQKAHGIASNTWATSVDQIRDAITRPQPVLIGIDWYEAWFQPETKNGEPWLQPIANAGQIAGGHEIGIWACSDRRQAFGLANTWGASWPPLVWIPYVTMVMLFAQGADACVIQDLASR